MTYLQSITEPIIKKTDYTAMWSNSFDTSNLTLGDISRLGQIDNPLRFIGIADEVPVKDYGGYENPLVIVHFGNATIWNPEQKTEEQWYGVFLQQKYYMNPAQKWNTRTGTPDITDAYGAGEVLAEAIPDYEYMEYIKTDYWGYQRMWIPSAAHVLPTGAHRFDYYADTSVYVARIASALSSAPTVAASCIGSYCVYATAVQTGYYYCSASASGVSGSTLNLASTNFYPRMCCFIKWNKVEES
ncbi:MAG: hypothetical protein NC218_03815 [Acetobacter sp.]|nr:hypothetical protein [Acetobacter sp.]